MLSSSARSLKDDGNVEAESRSHRLYFDSFEKRTGSL